MTYDELYSMLDKNITVVIDPVSGEPRLLPIGFAPVETFDEAMMAILSKDIYNTSSCILAVVHHIFSTAALTTAEERASADNHARKYLALIVSDGVRAHAEAIAREIRAVYMPTSLPGFRCEYCKAPSSLALIEDSIYHGKIYRMDCKTPGCRGGS